MIAIAPATPIFSERRRRRNGLSTHSVVPAGVLTPSRFSLQALLLPSILTEIVSFDRKAARKPTVVHRAALLRKSKAPHAGPELDSLVAEKVMGWKELERQGNRSWGKKRDKAGRWRRAAVPDYSAEPALAYEIEHRMREIGLWNAYMKELASITHGKQLPVDWATPEDRCRAGLNAVLQSRSR
jgi:hypothetical protein